MKQLILGLIAFATVSSANAVSLRYKFKVFSSGSNIYACNAGIMPQETNKKVCYFQDTNQACNPDDCSTTGTNCNSSCICSSSNGGEWLMNYGTVDYQDWKDNGNNAATGVVRGQVFRGTSGSSWQTALNETDSWNKRITNLEFSLGSELYSAKYFVDICYRGPQMEYFEDNVTANFSLRAQAYATDFLSTAPNGGENDRTGIVIPGITQKYTQLAGIKVESFVTCDLQGLGVLKYARNSSNQYNTTQNEATFNLSALGLPTGAYEGPSSFFASTPMSISSSAADLINTYITNNSSKTPRFCKVRYIFTETNVNTAVPNLRRWERHGAEMCTFTEVNEDAVN